MGTENFVLKTKRLLAPDKKKRLGETNGSAIRKNIIRPDKGKLFFY